MLQRIFNRLFPKTVTVVRLNQQVLQEFCRQVGGSCVVTNQTTPHMAGYQLGINHAISVLSKGFTVSDS